MAAHDADLQRLLDREAIRGLMARYFQGIDAADPAQVRRCFTDDVRADYDRRTFVEGIDALMGVFRAFKNKASGEWKATSHFMGNLSFAVLTHDMAETETYAIAFLVTPGRDGDLLVMRSLRYLDRLRKTQEGWRICDRVQTLDWSCELPASFAAPMSQRIASTLAAREK